MDRSELFERAKKHGYRPDKKLTKQGKDGLKQELIDYFNDPQGKVALDRAPSWLREKPLEEIVDLLLQEVE